jgi:ABC-type transport system involved in multi-copper enzyme maturation permease subunit
MNPTSSRTLWLRQIIAIMRIDLRKTFFAKRGLWIYLLAFAPEVPMIGHWIFKPDPSGTYTADTLGQDVQIFAGIFQFFYLRIAIFFGCVGIFSNLFRGEMMDKSLHYYLLAPVRREVLVAGKFLSGLTAAIVIFGGSAILQFPAMFWHHGRELMNAYMFAGPGLSHLVSYFLASVLACIGYGSLFLAAGVLVRNPLIPAALLLVWEGINGFLPALLKKLSVIYWLQSICPVPMPAPQGAGRGNIMQLLIVDIDPAPAHIAIVNLLLISGFVLVWAAMRARKLEISYGTE